MADIQIQPAGGNPQDDNKKPVKKAQIGSDAKPIPNEMDIDMDIDAEEPATPPTKQDIINTNTGQDNSFALDDQDMMGDFTAKKAQKFKVPEIVRKKFPDLEDLIKTTESMNEDERDYWFQILPIMTEDQIRKFRDILISEKEQLAQLDKEYEQELDKLNEKHMLEWKEFEQKAQRKALTERETAHEEEEKAREEELLKRLADI
ncbi:hypothetical protein GF340_00145 [Candidatus Peregrinibacteria bacterium]|nr:hypothetical protein [Candidatus Peregrinibacteria bacterium]